MDGSSKAKKIACFSLTTANAGKLSDFYQKAFGCHIVETERVDGADFERLMGVQGGAVRTTLALGEQVVELLQFDEPGRPYPKETSASDLIFQHFAIVVSDMAKAYAHLCAIPHWTPISLGGPQKLPLSSGGVTAFKFRDPEGHPLELLAFPENDVPVVWQTSQAALYLGIDHSAISVSDVTASVAFYENLGFAVTSRSRNEGPAQQNLDGIQDVRVDVVALAINRSTPHLELLCYPANASSSPPRLRNNDSAATRIVLAGSDQRCLLDPDGHHVVFS
ncbi:MAG TPA: VOC family protein [Rhizomicrobium sp.]|nr:VOC family protein [Rhizomicrobium sp.]